MIDIKPYVLDGKLTLDPYQNIQTGFSLEAFLTKDEKKTPFMCVKQASTTEEGAFPRIKTYLFKVQDIPDFSKDLTNALELAELRRVLGLLTKNEQAIPTVEVYVLK